MPRNIFTSSIFNFQCISWDSGCPRAIREKNWFVQTHSHPVDQLCCKHKIIINFNFLVVHKSLVWLGHIFNDTVYIPADLIPFTLKNIYIECTTNLSSRQDECHIRINLNWNLWILTYICAKAFVWYLILCSNISMHILHSVLYTFPIVLSRRISWTIQSFLSWWSFPWFLWHEQVIQGWYCKEKLDTNHSKRSKGLFNPVTWSCRSPGYIRIIIILLIIASWRHQNLNFKQNACL